MPSVLFEELCNCRWLWRHEVASQASHEVWNKGLPHAKGVDHCKVFRCGRTELRYLDVEHLPHYPTNHNLITWNLPPIDVMLTLAAGELAKPRDAGYRIKCGEHGRYPRTSHHNRRDARVFYRQKQAHELDPAPPSCEPADGLLWADRWSVPYGCVYALLNTVVLLSKILPKACL